MSSTLAVQIQAQSDTENKDFVIKVLAIVRGTSLIFGWHWACCIWSKSRYIKLKYENKI